MALLIIATIVIAMVLIIFGMADETIRGTRGFEHVDQGGKIPHESEKGLATIKAALTTVKIGMLVSRNGETEPEVKLAITTDLGMWEYVADVQNIEQVLRGDPDWNIDTAFAAAIKLITYKRGCGAVVPMFLEALAGPIAITKGDRIAIGIEAGKVRKYIYTDAVAATDSLIEAVGTAEESDAGSAADDHVILVRLDQ